MSTEAIWLDSDTVIRVRGLADAVSGSYENSATVTANVYDQTDTAVTGATDISVAYVTSSDGDYAGEIQNTVTAFVEGDWYTIKITVAGTSYTTTYKLRRQAAYKGS